MAYEPTNWKTGDIVTAERLNKIEQFLANLEVGGVTKVTTHTETDGDTIMTVCDMTASEMLDAYNSGVLLIVETDEENGEDYIYLVYKVIYSSSASAYQFRISEGTFRATGDSSYPDLGGSN